MYRLHFRVSLSTFRLIFGEVLILCLCSIMFADPVQSANNLVAGDTDDVSFVTVLTGTLNVNTADDRNDSVCDTAHCSLREAINAANASPGTDTIAFNIPGAGPHTIQPGPGGLPVIIDPVVIDGTTQPDYAGTPRIVIDGSLAGASFVSGLAISGGTSTVRGLVISNFSFGGIFLLGTGGGNIIEGNYIGTDVTGTQEQGNRDGVYILNSANNRVGGTALGTRNIISGNNDDGVNLEGPGSTGNQIQGNYIGLTANGSAALGNAQDGIKISGTSSNNMVGGTMPGMFNIIAHNRLRGVYIEAGATATGNEILRNTIASNQELAIDLGGDGLTENDENDVDSGPNNLQNYPILHDATASDVSTTIIGTLNSTPDTLYRIEFFQNEECDSLNYEESESFLGATTVTTNGNGTVSISFVAPTELEVGRSITATATNLDTNDTSEFSPCVTIIQASS